MFRGRSGRGFGAIDDSEPEIVDQVPATAVSASTGAPTPNSAAATVEAQAPPSTYAVAAVLDGEPGAWSRLAGLTFLRALFIFPGLYLGAKLVSPEMKFWQVGVLSVTSSAAITGGMLALYKFQKESQAKVVALDGVGRYGSVIR